MLELDLVPYLWYSSNYAERQSCHRGTWTTHQQVYALRTDCPQQLPLLCIVLNCCCFKVSQVVGLVSVAGAVTGPGFSPLAYVKLPSTNKPLRVLFWIEFRARPPENDDSSSSPTY